MPKSSRRIRMASAFSVIALSSVLVMGAEAKPRVRAVLPDLVPLAPEDIRGPATEVGTSIYNNDAPVRIEGCYVDERVRKEAARCLRFDAIVANFGRGPLEVAFTVDESEARASAYQRVFRNDGSYVDRFAIESEFHPNHAHFHVAEFYVARLWRATKNGGRKGRSSVAGGDKNGFCPMDQRRLDEDGSQRGYYDCFQPEDDEPARNRMWVVGLSPGWVDTYPYEYVDQFVEITGIEDGYYVLEIEIDPNGVFKEQTRANNAVCVRLRLEGTRAELLDPLPSC